MLAAKKHDDDYDLAEEALHWIVRLNSGEADQGLFEAFAKWRSASLLNEQAAKEAETLWTNMSGLYVEPSNGFVRLDPATKKPSRRHVLTGLVAIGTLGLMSGSLWGIGALRRFSADYVSMTAELQSIELSDGSRMTLNARSAIDVQFDNSVRRVLLREGQAYFEVAADRSRPFEVMVGRVSVVALGTEFDVSCNLVDASAEIAVTDHTVLVRSELGMTEKLSAGQLLRVDKVGKLGVPQVQDVSLTAAWRNRTYIAENRALGDIIAALSSWYSGVIYLRERSLAELRVNTVLDLKDPVGSLDTLEAGLPIKVRHYSSLFAVISAS